MAESLRDQLAANYDQLVSDTQSETPTPPIEAPASTPTPAAATQAEKPVEAPDKPGRTAGRERDDQGRLLPGAARKPEAPITVAPVVPEVKRPQRPSSWKKDYWEHWDKLDPKVAEYINQREGEYAKGVSTYKGEWENAKPLLDVVQSHSDVIQQTGLQPAQWVNELGTAHRILTQGTPEQKLNTVLQIAINNGVDLRKLGEKLFVRGDDGQLYMNQNLRPAQQPQPQQPPRDVRKEVSAILAEERANQEIASMKSDTEKYPHFESVRQTMLGLLQGGLAQDLPSAYQASIRLPQHSEIWDAIQEQKRTQEDAEKRAKEAARVASAKAAAVSPKGATPTGTPANGKKGLRATIEAAVDEHAGAGRV